MVRSRKARTKSCLQSTFQDTISLSEEWWSILRQSLCVRLVTVLICWLHWLYWAKWACFHRKTEERNVSWRIIPQRLNPSFTQFPDCRIGYSLAWVGGVDSSRIILQQAMTKMGLSVQAYDRILKLIVLFMIWQANLGLRHHMLQRRLSIEIRIVRFE